MRVLATLEGAMELLLIVGLVAWCALRIAQRGLCKYIDLTTVGARRPKARAHYHRHAH